LLKCGHSRGELESLNSLGMEEGELKASRSSSQHLLRLQQTVGFYKVNSLFSSGAYSEIFLGKHTLSGTYCALKICRPQSGGSIALIEWESDVLLKMQRYPFVARHLGLYEVIGGGVNSPESPNKVLAMGLLGPNISSLRRNQLGTQFSLAASLHIVLQMLHCVEALHQEGFVHRDLKPSTFCVQRHNSKVNDRSPSINRRHMSTSSNHLRLCMLDFSQSRQYIIPGSGHGDSAKVRPARSTCEFRGTSLYSSFNAHMQQDLGRRDDIWSLFYMLVDMTRGGLPWRRFQDDAKKCELLKKYYLSKPDELLFDLPDVILSHMLELHNHIASLSFSDKPEYSRISDLFRIMIKAANDEKIAHHRLRPSYPEMSELSSLMESSEFLGDPQSTLRRLQAPGAEVEVGLKEEEEEEEGEWKKPAPVSSLADLSTKEEPHVVALPTLPPLPLPPSDIDQAQQDIIDKNFIRKFDLTHTIMTVDTVLHSRFISLNRKGKKRARGQWGPIVFSGILLDDALTVDSQNSGLPSGAAVSSKDALVEYERACQMSISGWEWEKVEVEDEEDDNEDNDKGDTSTVTIDMEEGIEDEVVLNPLNHTRPDLATLSRVPRWLRLRRRGSPMYKPFFSTSTPSLKELEIAFDEMTRRLNDLPLSFVWGAWAALDGASAAYSTPELAAAAAEVEEAGETEDFYTEIVRTAISSAREYASVWCGLATASLSFLKHYINEENVPSEFQLFMQRLMNEALLPRPLPQGIEDIRHEVLINGAKDGRQIITQNPILNIPIPMSVRSDTLVHFSSHFKSFKPGCLHLQQVCCQTISLLERWIQTCKKKSSPTSTLSSLSNPMRTRLLREEYSEVVSPRLFQETPSSTVLFDSSAELNDLAIRRSIARRDLVILRRLLEALEVEQAIHAPISNLEVSLRKSDPHTNPHVVVNRKRSRWESTGLNTNSSTDMQTLLGAAVASGKSV
jgi:serine/threonine protein kinase